MEPEKSHHGDHEHARGEPAVLQRLIASREAFVGFVRKRISDPELAEDVVQESLLRALRSAPHMEEDERLLSWFYRVLQNAVVDTYRRRSVGEARLPTTSLGENAEHIPDPGPEEVAQLCECFRELLPTIDPGYRDLIESMDLAGERPESAAARLSITPNNLKVRRYRARQALRRRLEETCRSCAAHGCLDCTCRHGDSPA